jgi:DNA mismatch repair protein MutL
MSVIRILPEKVASQIAAGEVIARPSSVVRELLDNSIDAGAERIAVKIQRGGIGLIRVTDNGIGMTRDDILLCVERHATSKIETSDDLFSIKTLGFRGEALPSIASVSRMKITSRQKQALVGHTLRIAGGEPQSIEEAGASVGALIEVRDIFYNVPVRRKFLRAPKTEGDHIQDVLIRTALPYTNIHCSLEQGDKTVVRFPATEKLIQRLSVLMGVKVSEAMIQHQSNDNGIAVTVYLAPPEFSRRRGDRLFVYVNGRNIKDRFATRAILDGYGQRLMKGQYPQAAVFIEVDPAAVDVNVHPAKEEVRFHNSFGVFRAIVAVIENAFSRTLYQVPAVNGNPFDFGRDDGADSVSDPVAGDCKDNQAWLFSDNTKNKGQFPAHEGGLHIIGQLGNSYILCQSQEGLMIIDQHAAHERIVYEKLKKDLDTSRINSQALLIPQQIELSLKEKRLALEKRRHLADFGIELDHFGGHTFLLRSYPLLLKHVQWDSFLPEVLLEIEKKGPTGDILFDNILTIMACHGAIRAGDRMSYEAMAELVEQLEQADLPSNCPHGRPVYKKVAYREIEKMFKRVI